MTLFEGSEPMSVTGTGRIDHLRLYRAYDGLGNSLVLFFRGQRYIL